MIQDELLDEAVKIKVALIGESGVGKTSIISSFVNKKYEPMQLSTQGASFANKIIYLEENNQFINYEIWDTAGQEKYRALAKVFYKGANVILLVYDITRKDSFEELQKFWYLEIKNNAQEDISKHLIVIVLMA